MKIPSKPGIYCLWNKITDFIYVGSSRNLQKRINKHFSPKCQNPHLKSSIKKHGRENFSISWHETEDFIDEEQKLLNFVFNPCNKIKTYNVAVKAGGNPGGSRERQRELSLKGKSRKEWRELCEAGGGLKCIPLYLIDTKTQIVEKIESSYEGERLGLGSQKNLSTFSKITCLNRVKNCLVAKSEKEAKVKLESWLLIPKNNPIVLILPENTEKSVLCKLANVNPGNFSQMYRKVLNPSTGEPLRSSMQSKADFNWFGTEVKAGDWFSCTVTTTTH